MFLTDGRAGGRAGGQAGRQTDRQTDTSDSITSLAKGVSRIVHWGQDGRAEGRERGGFLWKG